MRAIQNNNWIMKAKISILNQLIEKGGIYGHAAKLYFMDEEKSTAFIFECFAQCHVPQAKINWGDKLIKEIRTYCLAIDKNVKPPDFTLKYKGGRPDI
jgi:hypothetical protein